MTAFSFCESVTATSYSKWHIRRLTKAGKKFGGGIDTGSLCGLIKLPLGGWDLEVDITKHHLTHCCSKCKALYLEEIQRDSDSANDSE
jgi:hypothetical protein